MARNDKDSKAKRTRAKVKPKAATKKNAAKRKSAKPVKTQRELELEKIVAVKKDVDGLLSDVETRNDRLDILYSIAKGESTTISEEKRATLFNLKINILKM